MLRKQISKESGGDGEHKKYTYITEEEYTKIVNSDGETSYFTDDNNFEAERCPFQWEYFEIFKFSLEEVSKQNGEIWIRYTSDELTESVKENYGEEWGDTRYGELILTNDGLIRGGEMVLGEKGETEQYGHLKVSVDSIGETTVEEPEWLDEAKSATSN